MTKEIFLKDKNNEQMYTSNDIDNKKDGKIK